MVDAGVKPKAGLRDGRDGAKAVGSRTRFRLQPGRERGVIRVGMGDEDVGHRFAAQGMKQGGKMRVVRRAGIDHRHLPAAHDEGRGSLEGVRAGIIDQHAAHQRRDLHHITGTGIKFPIECKSCHRVMQWQLRYAVAEDRNDVIIAAR